MELLKRIQELLRTKDVTAEIDKDGELSFLTRTGPISVRIRISVREKAIIVCSFIPIFVPVQRRAPVVLGCDYAQTIHRTLFTSDVHCGVCGVTVCGDAERPEHDLCHL